MEREIAELWAVVVEGLEGKSALELIGYNYGYNWQAVDREIAELWAVVVDGLEGEQALQLVGYNYGHNWQAVDREIAELWAVVAVDRLKFEIAELWAVVVDHLDGQQSTAAGWVQIWPQLGGDWVPARIAPREVGLVHLVVDLLVEVVVVVGSLASLVLSVPCSPVLLVPEPPLGSF
eukprot:s7619_g2.t1